MNIPVVRTAIATALSGISGLRFYATVPDTPIVPCIVVYPERVAYRQTFEPDPVAESTFIVHVLAASVSNKSGQDLLDAYLSDTGAASIPAAIDADTSLGGHVQIAEVVELRNYGTVELVEGGVRYYSAQLVVSIYAA